MINALRKLCERDCPAFLSEHWEGTSEDTIIDGVVKMNKEWKVLQRSQRESYLQRVDLLVNCEGLTYLAPIIPENNKKGS